MSLPVVKMPVISSEEIVKINSKPLDAAELKRLDKLEKEGVGGVVAATKDIRLQLSEQLKCLDGRLDTQQAIVSEVQEIFRRRAEIEASYSKDLHKLANSIMHRHKEQKQKRDNWSLHSSTQVWELLVAQTKRASKDHSVLSEIYSNHILQRCSNINEDLQRIYKKCREIGYEIHEEVLKVLHELHTAMKTHHNYQSEFRQAENKLQLVRKQREKLQSSVPPEKREKHKKYKLIDKEYQKRSNKYEEARIKATKARNEYLLNMDAANSSIQKYFVDDLSDLIDCMDFGFHQSLSRAVLMHVSGVDQRRRTLQQDIDQLHRSLGALDSRHDKQKFIETNNNTFMIPKKFEYNPVRRDESESLVSQKQVLDELEMRKVKLMERLTQLKTESEEIWKSMETAERNLSDMVGANDYDTTRFFVEEDRMAKEPDTVSLKQKADRKETEDFYTNKFREYVLNSNRIARLQAKYDHIRNALGDQTSQPVEGVLTLTRRPNAARRRRIGNNSRPGGQPKLFGGSLEEYLEETNQDIPMIIRSCVRVINLFGLHHHGIFRVSGAQVEINNFRDAFERGDDPLAEMTDASDINSVAGVLKLYLRELREPVFPIQYFDHFMELAQLESKHEFVIKVRDVVKTWPRPVFVVMRYLFAFLNHLSEFSDENMMDPWNLAICFGPTLVPIPEERDQVQFQNLVNELIKNFIIFHEDIFPSSVIGPKYEKYLGPEPDDMDMAEAPSEPGPEEDAEEPDNADEEDSVFQEETDKEDYRDMSLELFGKSEVLEATALYDFKARSSREVNFHKGDTILLYKQVSGDWWRGAVNNQEGLIPDKYIVLKIRGDDERERLESARSLEDGPASSRERSLSLASAAGSRNRNLSSTSDTTQPSLTQSPVALRRSGGQPASPSATATSSAAGGAQRNSRSPSTTVISVLGAGVVAAAATAAAPATVKATSRESLSLDSGNQSPDTTTTTQRLSSMTDSRGADADSLLADEDHSRVEASTSSSSSHTHIIRVSGPVTNLDDTVMSATSTTTSSSGGAGGGSRKSCSPSEPERSSIARSRVPISPSLEAQLKSPSQDSLLSTGSNQELKNQLDSTIAQVEAFAKEIEKRKKASTVSLPPKTLVPSSSPNAPFASSSASNTLTSSKNSNAILRRKFSADSASVPSAPTTTVTAHAQPALVAEEPSTAKPQSGGARPRVPKVAPRTVTPEASTSVPHVVWRQSSWGSRDQVGESQTEEEKTSFAQNRSRWEKRTTTTTPTAAAAASQGSGIKTNKEYWKQRQQQSNSMRQKQTPDLVLDLPTQQQPVPKPRSLALPGSNNHSSSSSSSGESSHEEPATTPTDHFAKDDQDTVRKSARVASSAAAAAASLRSAHVRPQVRVKPQPQIKSNQQADSSGSAPSEKIKIHRKEV